MERGDAMLNQRNVVAARLLFARAADAGVGIAALKLAQTYDSGFIADHNLIGIKGDQHEAEIWYRKAAALGERQAEQRLKALEERRKTLATQ
jgi:TPR repeat protein